MSEKEGLPTEVDSGIETSPEDEQEDTEFKGNDQDLAGRLEQAESKAQEHYDAMMRARAELENVTRRADKKVEDAHKFALERFVQELLPVMDSLEMGLIAAQDEDADVAKLREGSELILKMFQSALGKFNLEDIDPLDQPFDPEFHQAMSMADAPDKEPDTVIAVMQKGYTLNGRLVRPAMVVVAKAPAEESAD